MGTHHIHTSWLGSETAVKLPLYTKQPGPKIIKQLDLHTKWLVGTTDTILLLGMNEFSL